MAGPVVIDSGAGKYLESMIRMGLVQLLFAGNGFAAHDIELSLFGTAAGVLLDRGVPLEYGHENYLRAINTVRKAGSIAGAVEAGTLSSGVMHACIRHRVDFVLAGSIRDDGPLPDTITDSLEAQDAMRRKVQGVKTALMLGTTLHSIAVANLLPASVRIVSVDVNSGTVERLQARSPYLNLGFVADVDGFLRAL
ncbi:MAG: TIGR00300 family protein, partial [Armatimonadetes bacterium]|nr:TIGR00300 family protein [Armatimonadota bacterium]